MISMSRPAKTPQRPLSGVGLCLVLGLLISALPACGAKAGESGATKPEPVKVKGPDTVVSEWVEAYRARDYVALSELSTGHVGGIVKEILRRRRLDDGLFQTLSTHYPTLKRSSFDEMFRSINEKRFTEATVDPTLDGFLESPNPQTRIYQVGHFDQHERRAYHRFTVSQGEDGRWTVSDVDDERFSGIVKIDFRNGNLTLERSYGRLAARLSRSQPAEISGAIEVLRKIGKQVTAELADDSK